LDLKSKQNNHCYPIVEIALNCSKYSRTRLKRHERDWIFCVVIKKGQIGPTTCPRCPEGSRKLRFPDYVTMAQDGGKVVSPTYRSLLPPGNTPGTHFCWSLRRPQARSAIRRIISMKNSNDTIWNRTNDLPICSTAP